MKKLFFTFLSIVAMTPVFAQDMSYYDGYWEGACTVSESKRSQYTYKMEMWVKFGKNTLNGKIYYYTKDSVQKVYKTVFKYNPADYSISEIYSSNYIAGCPGVLQCFFDGNNFLKLNGRFVKEKKEDCLAVSFELNKLTGNPFLRGGYPFKYKDSIHTIEATEFDDFKEGLAVIRKGEKFAVIDGGGNFLVPWGKYKFNKKGSYEIDTWLCRFSNGMCIVRDPETEMYGFINDSGRLVVPCILSDAQPFMKDGYGWGKEVKENDKKFFYYMNRSGQKFPVKEVRYDEKPSDEEYLTRKNESNGFTAFYDKTGRFVFRTRKRVTGPYSDGLIRVDTTYELAGAKTGFIDTLGRMVIPYRSERIGDFSNGFALIQQATMDEYAYGFLNKKNEIQIKLRKTDSIWRIETPSDFMPLVTYSTTSGYVSLVEINGKKASINPKGEISILQDLLEKKSYEWYLKSRKKYQVYQFPSRNESLYRVPFALEYSYEMPLEMTTGGIGGGRKLLRAEVKQDGGMGLTDLAGNMMALPVFNRIGPFDDYSLCSKAFFTDPETKIKTQGYIDHYGNFIIIVQSR